MTTSTKRKICVFLGNRANYSSLRPLMKEIQKRPELELILFVGAAALLDKFGSLVDLVTQDGFKINETLYMVIEGYNQTTMAQSTGLGLIELAGQLDKYRPDFCLAVGDRHEMLAFVIAAAFFIILSFDRRLCFCLRDYRFCGPGGSSSCASPGRE